MTFVDETVNAAEHLLPNDAVSSYLPACQVDTGW